MIKINTIETAFRACHSITQEINDFVTECGITEGLLTITVPNTTSGLAITSFWDKLGLEDMLDEIDRSFPTLVDYKLQTSPYDSSAHIKSSVFKNAINVLISNGKPVLGSSQGVVLMDYDGPRELTYVLKATAFNATTINTVAVDTTFMGMHDLSEQVNNLVSESNVKNGLVHIAVLHSTAGLVLADNSKPTLFTDIMNDIERIVPTRVNFKHRETASDAGGHIKTALTGTQISLPIKDGEILISEEQSIVFAEYDGPRPRKVTVGILESRATNE